MKISSECCLISACIYRLSKYETYPCTNINNFNFEIIRQESNQLTVTKKFDIIAFLLFTKKPIVFVHIAKVFMKRVFSGTRMNTVDLFHAGKQKFKALFIEFNIIFVQFVFIIMLYL